MDPILIVVAFILFALGKGKGIGGGGGGGGSGTGTGGGGVGGTGSGLVGTKVPEFPPPKPAVFAAPTTIGEPAPPPVAPKLTLSADCKTVTEAPGWWDLSGLPLAQDLVDSGNGLPYYSPADAGRSVDAVIRTIVANLAGTACIDSAPWLDRYVGQHPLPKPQPNQTRADYRAALTAWDAQWDATFSAWAQAHSQAFNLFRKIGVAVVALWAQRVGVALGAGPGQPGNEPPPSGQGGNATAGEQSKLRQLGYDIYPMAAEDFQVDYNLVRNNLTGGLWGAVGFGIATDGVVGPQTRAALDEALLIGGNADGWRLQVAAAVNA